ncbi:MAG TPA: universal stress protein [Gaiellaceae bacterium]|jgi:nucleotide-binding universal stress UspA family protein|nr:universal stress protein [Gaiellaceae bacterium]
MFRRVMWATDGLAAADMALPFAKALVPVDGVLLAVHCNELLVGRAAGYPLRADEQDLQRKIRTQVAQAREEGIAVELTLVTVMGVGPARRIAETATELGADVLVVGTRGHAAITGLLTGNTTRRLLHIAPCPVFAVGPGAKPIVPGRREPVMKAAA